MTFHLSKLVVKDWDKRPTPPLPPTGIIGLMYVGLMYSVLTTTVIQSGRGTWLIVCTSEWAYFKTDLTLKFKKNLILNFEVVISKIQTFQSGKWHYIHKCPSVSLSVTKTPLRIKDIYWKIYNHDHKFSIFLEIEPLTLNISVNSSQINDSFRILMARRFQNWP